MKNKITLLLLICIVQLKLAAQNIGINATGALPNQSAMLDVSATNKGVLIPRMTSAQRIAIATPAAGLLVYDIVTKGFWFYNGLSWVQLTSGAASNYWTLNGNNIFKSNIGNVGIGINTPLAPLHIKKDLEALRLEGTSPYITFYNTAGAVPKVFMQNAGNNFYLGTSAGNINGILQFYLNNSPKMTILPNGNVGINNNTPNNNAILDINSTTKGLLIPRMSLAQRNLIVLPATSLMIYQTDNIPGYYYYNGAGWVQLASGAASNYWSLNGTNIFKTNPGNVGIGTNNPKSLLTLQTPINTTGWTHIGGADSIVVTEGIGGVSASIGTTSNHAFRIHTNGTGKFSVYPAGEVVVGSNATGSFGKFTVGTPNNSYGISHISDQGNILATRIGGTSAGIGTFSNTNMRIFSNSLSAIFIAAATGNVGIGTDNPTYKLSVAGNIHTTEVVVETGWADYVFDKKYKLPLLSDVEKFIQLNQHLPNIPSAAEIETNGLHLGDTQKRMMEKIEELTLYMIEANKRIALLEQLLQQKK
jgi:hypothetical protein